MALASARALFMVALSASVLIITGRGGPVVGDGGFSARWWTVLAS